jgi:hypothetical protein
MKDSPASRAMSVGKVKRGAAADATVSTS